jgi:hypothetical protein
MDTRERETTTEGRKDGTLLRRVLRVVHGALGDERLLQHLRHVVPALEEGGDERAQQRRLHEPDEGPEGEAGEVRRLHRLRAVPHGGDVHLLHRGHGARGGARPAHASRSRQSTGSGWIGSEGEEWEWRN